MVSFRYSKYRQMLVDFLITPQELPSSEEFTCYHGFRVHLQINLGKMLDETQSLNPRNMIWKKDDGYLVPIFAGKDAAPANIPKVISVGVNHFPKINVESTSVLVKRMA